MFRKGFKNKVIYYLKCVTLLLIILKCSDYMDYVFKISENPWILSIVTGVIVFFVTWPINSWITKRTSKKEYYDKVNNANMQIVRSCENYVIISRNKNEVVFENIIKGICHENKINADDVYDVQSVISILINNFIGMRLISNEDKMEIINNLIHQENKCNFDDNLVNLSKISHQKGQLNKELNYLTTLITSITSVMATVIIYVITILNDEYELSFIDSIELIILIFALAIIEISFFLVIKKRKKSKEKENFKTEDNKNDFMSEK